MTIFLPLYFVIVIGLSMWDRKSVAALPDEERLKVLDALSRASFTNLIPMAVLLVAFVAFRTFFPHALHAGMAVYVVLIALATWGNAYLLHRKLAGKGISPAYMRNRTLSTVVRGLAIGLFLAGVLYTSEKPVGS